MTETFRDLGVDAALCDALEAKGITHPFPIQALTLPMALAGDDLIGQARTGTGKTLAFGLPLLERIDPDVDGTQALVIVPTRELCVQVHEDLTIGTALGIRSIAVYGGTPYEEQTEALESGVHVVVGTPGRLLDHLNRGTLDLSRVRVLVLDEADEMLDMGFLPDVERLIESCPTERHTMLFSATMPTAIVRMGRRYMISPTFTRADQSEGETAPKVDQHFMLVHRMDKPRLLARLLQSRDRGNVYVFVRTKHMADRLVEELADLGSEAIAIHGDLRQTTRERNLERFRDGKVSVLVATEVAARGLDVQNVSHVVNYDCPEDEKMYLHRIGRTARAGRAGVAVTFVEHQEAERANLIRRAIDRTDLEVRETFSTSPELIELFDLPDEVPWARSVARRRSGGDGDRGRGGRGDQGGRGGRGDQGGRGGRGDQGGRGGRGGRGKGSDQPRDEGGRGGRGEQGGRGGRGGDAGGQRGKQEQDADGGSTRDGDRQRRPRKRSRSGSGAAAASAASSPASDSASASGSTATQDTGGDAPGRERSDRGSEGASGSGGQGGRRRRGGRGRRGGGGGGERGGGERGGAGARRGGAESATSGTSSTSTSAPQGQPGESAAQRARRVKVEHLP